MDRMRREQVRVVLRRDLPAVEIVVGELVGRVVVVDAERATDGGVVEVDVFADPGEGVASGVNAVGQRPAVEVDVRVVARAGHVVGLIPGGGGQTGVEGQLGKAVAGAVSVGPGYDAV